jgi:hypothetical protein
MTVIDFAEALARRCAKDPNLHEIGKRLPEEARAWLRSLDEGERSVTERIILRNGDEHFVRHWRNYRDQCQYARDF